MSWLRYLKILSFLFLICNFQGTWWCVVLSSFTSYLIDWISSVIRKLKSCFYFNSLITGKTSYRNSTALLMRLAPISCCSSLACIYMNLPNICSGSASCSSIFIAWRPPTLPHRLQWSTIGRLSLNHRVRDGNGCYPQAHRHQNSLLSF